jgi:hypothetical protein
MGAYGGLAFVGRAPGVENASHSGEHPFQVGCLLLQERSDVNTRGGSGASERDDLLDLGQREPQPACPSDELKQPQYARQITPVARWCASARREDAARLVESQRLAAQPAPARDFADE